MVYALRKRKSEIFILMDETIIMKSNLAETGENDLTFERRAKTEVAKKGIAKMKRNEEN